MKKLKLLLSALVLIAFAENASAQTSATATANAKIVSAISIVNDDDLDFGSIVPSTGGTVSIAATSGGTRTSGGAVVLTSAPTSPAKFTVTGDGNATYAITRLPASGTPIQLNSGGNNMSAALIVSAGGTGAETATGRIGGTTGTNGTQEIFIGGTLTVGNAQAAGTYVSGNITITVAYN